MNPQLQYLISEIKINATNIENEEFLNEEFLENILTIGSKIDDLIEEFDLPENKESMKESAVLLGELICLYYEILDLITIVMES